jgi:hypothetical protein
MFGPFLSVNKNKHKKINILPESLCLCNYFTEQTLDYFWEESSFERQKASIPVTVRRQAYHSGYKTQLFLFSIKNQQC